MTYALNRPAATFDAAAGLLRTEHFQMAYVTNDADAAIDLFSRRLGVREFVRLEGPNPAGGHVRAEFAWVGSIMYEIIEARGPGTEIFSERMPAGDTFQMVHHHLGYLIPDLLQWEALLANAREQGWTIPLQDVNSLVHVCFAEIPGVPHYLEFLYPSEAGQAFFESVPRT